MTANPKLPPDTSWLKTAEIREGRMPRPLTLTEGEVRAVFDREDERLGRWAIFAGGVGLGAMVTGLVGWLFG